VFVDKDGRGYMIYSDHHLIFVEQLTPDLLQRCGHRRGDLGRQHQFSLTAFPVDFVEAPVLFERHGIYYALFGHCCCFCYQGSDMFVFQAPHPLGPWKQQSNADLECANATTPTPAHPGWGSKSLPLTAIPTPGQGCLYQNTKQASTCITRARQNFVVQVETASGSEYIWTGDRWMQTPGGIKDEPQFWGKLEFDAVGNVLPLKWVNSISVDMKHDQGK
jgi:beta-xylosidase